MLSINTNLSSIIAQESMKQSTNKLNQAIERMTTGAKINHASDNAANYSISTNMTTRIGAYQVAEDNAAMGLDMLNTASDTISEMQSHGERLRALATQARNGTYGKQSLEAIQAEANAIYDEINRIYSTAKYNGISLFNQSEYDIPDNMPKADPITGFIEDPYDYSEEDLKGITSISKVTDSFTKSEYKIETVADLAKLAKLTNDGVDATGVTFILANDLDLKEYCEEHKDDGGWTPIGNESNTFKGSFNGNGNVISNLTINRPTASYQGLFGYCQIGAIENLGITEANINAYGRCGIMVGSVNTTINNCFSAGVIEAIHNIGGLIGIADSLSRFENCYAESVVKGETQVGGLIGQTSGYILRCYTDCKVQGLSRVGGLCGRSYQSVKDSYSKSDVIGVSQTGGLLGAFWLTTGEKQLEKNGFYGSVSGGPDSTGSLIGVFVNTSDEINFGILKIKNSYVVQLNSPKIASCYNTSFQKIDYDLTSMLDGIEEIRIRSSSTNLQIGTKSESSSQIGFNANFEYNLGKIVRNGIGSDSALNAIDEFVNLLSDKQTELGAAQNRLESALDEISTQYENLVSARSTLRDADMAEVSSSYIQQQILQEASATLMATANQSPAIALQLI